MTKLQLDKAIGGRDYMEDYSLAEKISEDKYFMAICDGHGGYQCAKFIINQLKKQLNNISETNLEEIIKKISLEWDKICIKFLGAKTYPKNEQERNQIFEKASEKDLLLYEKLGYSSGSTLSACFVYAKNKAIIANVGDSRTVVYDKDYNVILSTKDHKPKKTDLGKIKGIITKEEGDVKRINGELAVGRAIGDNTPGLMGSLKRKPDLYNVTDFQTIVLGSDGIWDVLKINELKNLSAKQIIQLILKKEYKNSLDNLTVIVFSN